MVQRTTGQRISTLFGKNLPSHPPDPVAKVVDDDAELPYRRSVGHVSTYTGTIVVFPICGYDLVDLILYDLNLIIIRELRKGHEILLPPRAKAYMPTPEASDQGLRIIIIFQPYRAVRTVWLILFHLLFIDIILHTIRAAYPAFLQSISFFLTLALPQGILIDEIPECSQSQRNGKSPASIASLDTYHDAIYVEFIPLRAKTPTLPMKYLQ